MRDKAIWDMPSREEMMLREIEAQLRQYEGMDRPLRAADMTVTVMTDRWAEIMAWAQIGLRDYVLARKHSIENAAVTIKPMLIAPE